MTDRVEEKIKLFCEKGNMDIKNLKIIKSDEGYVASDKHMSMMFDEGGKPVSLPLNKPMEPWVLSLVRDYQYYI